MLNGKHNKSHTTDILKDKESDPDLKNDKRNNKYSESESDRFISSYIISVKNVIILTITKKKTSIQYQEGV